MFGEKTMRDQVAKGPGARTALLVIMAHEYGHIRQFRERRGGACPDVELEADFLAGWALGRESLRPQGRGIPVDLRTAAATAYGIGDYAFNSPSHHGTPQERLTALLRGFELGRQRADVDAAYHASLRAG